MFWKFSTRKHFYQTVPGAKTQERLTMDSSEDNQKITEIKMITLSEKKFWPKNDAVEPVSAILVNWLIFMMYFVENNASALSVWQITASKWLNLLACKTGLKCRLWGKVSECVFWTGLHQSVVANVFSCAIQRNLIIFKIYIYCYWANRITRWANTSLTRKNLGWLIGKKVFF